MKFFNLKKYWCIAVLCTTALYAQDETIGLQSFHALNPAQDYVEAEMVFQKIKEALVHSKSYKVLDRESLGLVMDEQEIQKQITSINAKVVDQGKVAGAQHIIGGKLFNVQYKKIPKILGNSSVAGQEPQRAVFSFSLDIIDTETSQTLESETFKVGFTNIKSIGGLTQQEAFQNALISIEKDFEKFLSKFVSKPIAIVAIEEEKGNEATKVLINAGKATGAKKNDKISIYELSTLSVGGKDVLREKWIADIKIDAIEGDELATAKVLKGGDNLLEKYNNQSRLICKSN